jgi:MoaA/NifB/PqqE/SkfB family radical SAM enzyme
MNYMPYVDSVVRHRVCTVFPEFSHPYIEKVFRNRKYLMKKKLNFLINSLEKKLRCTYLYSYPYYLVIDPTNRCNLRCPLCPTWQDTTARAKGVMDINKFKKLLDEIGAYLFAINFCNWGEPLLSTHVFDMISYAKTHNLVAGLGTNLNHLPNDSAKRLIDSNVDIIVISLDGISQETYSKYRVGGDISAVCDNLDKLLSYRTCATEFPLIIWQFIVNKYNEHEIESAAAMAEEKGLMFLPAMMRTSMGKELLLPLHERVKEMEEWRPTHQQYYRYNYDITRGTRTKQTTCKWLWNSSVVNWDFSVSPCCAVYERSWDFSLCYSDSLDRATFHKAWNSPRYVFARKLVADFYKNPSKSGSITKHGEKRGIICTKCVRFGFLED